MGFGNTFEMFDTAFFVAAKNQMSLEVPLHLRVTCLKWSALERVFFRFSTKKRLERIIKHPSKALQ